jgi:uncharacterized protein YpbB
LLFQQILLTILSSFHKERTISAAYHLLKGKRSGQTIQDVGLFKLYPYFGLLPKLSRQKFEEQVDLLFAKNNIVLEEDGYYRLTDAGQEAAKAPLDFFFDGWHYRGNEHLFFARLSLIVQSLSHQQNAVKAFIPIERNEQVQQWVRQFLIRQNYGRQLLQQPLYEEITNSLGQLPIDEHLKDIVVYRFTGFNQPGYTWQQLAFGYHMQEMDIQLLYISTLHQWLNEIYRTPERYPILSALTQGVRVETLLTDSANTTAQLFKKGYSIEQICQMRKLKTSTIEDHLVELAMNDSSFSIESFVTYAEQQQIFDAVETYETKKLRILHEILPHISYFQLRLALAKGAMNS